MFGTMMLASWTVLLAYVLQRASSIPFVTRRVRPRLLLASGAVLWAGLVIPNLARGAALPRLSFVLETAVEHLLAAFFILAVPLLAVDLATGFGHLLRRAVPRARGVALGAGCLLCAVAVVQGNRAPVVTDYEVRLAGLPANLDGTVVAALSDLHLGGLLGERWLAGRVDQTMALRPDLVVLLGDTVEGHGEPDPALAPIMRRLRAPLGVWAVTGNHEGHAGDGAGVRLMEDAGARMLRDASAQVAPGLVIAGVDDPGHGSDPAGPGGRIDKALSGGAGGAVLLLSHRPLGAERAAADGVGLMLSGHTHDGQVWPFRYLVGLTTPYLSGRYAVGGMTLLVSRGTGTWGPRMRLFAPAQILRITLRAA